VQSRAALLPNFDSYIADQSQTRNLAAFGIQFKIPIPGFQVPTFVGPFSTFDVRAQATQSVLDLASIRRFQASRGAVRSAESENRATQDQVASQVAKAYLAAMVADAQVESAKANVDLGEALVKLALNQKTAGTGTAIEATRARVQLANQRQQLLVAENQRRQARLQLLRAMGMPLETQVETAEQLAFVAVDTAGVEQALETALKMRPDLKAQQSREESARLTYSAAKLERVPSLAAFGDYGSIGTGLNHALPTRTYGVQLRVPIFDGGRRDGRRAEGLSQFRQESIKTSDLKQQIGLEVRLALDALKSAADQVKVAEEGLGLAEAEVAQAQRRYSAGVTNSIEVTDAQARLERARQNRISALSGYNSARLDLGQAMGTIQSML
jgi:outer membrane protein